MIEAETRARITVATKLCEAKEIVLSTRSYICLDKSDNKKIDDIVSCIENIVNNVMGVGKGM